MPKRIRRIRIEGNLAYVPLTQGYEAVIDAADVPLVNKWNWYAHITPWNVYARRGLNASTDVYMHRAIMEQPKGFEIDHRDNNGLNNTRSNLRIATSSQNSHNQRIRKDNTSGYKGVSFYKRKGMFQAYIFLHGKKKHLGYFPTAEDAHEKYCAASEALHGEFGRVK